MPKNWYLVGNCYLALLSMVSALLIMVSHSQPVSSQVIVIVVELQD